MTLEQDFSNYSAKCLVDFLHSPENKKKHVLLIYIRNKVQVLVAQVHLPDDDETMHGKGETRMTH